MKTTRILVSVGLLISIEVVLTRFLSIQTPTVRIGFGFIPIALASIIFGPILGGVTAMLSDIIGMIIFPQGPYFPGVTLSAFLSGLIYGFILYKKPITIIRVAFAVLIVTLFVDLGLNTYWISIITGKAAVALIVPRLIKSAIMLPVQTFTIHLIWKYVHSFINCRIIC